MMSEAPTNKQLEFNAAMARYERAWGYRLTNKVASFANIGLQVVLGFLVFPQSIGLARQMCVLLVAYAVADFVNGWIHLYMDNGENYATLMGPFFAAFHLHHRTPRYRKRPLIVVYYQEAGSKLWLVLLELSMALLIGTGLVCGAWAYLMFYFAVLSTFAEVSHYLCHMAPSTTVRVLGKLGLLLSARYHARHHREDNVQYAFLNGMSDPLIDRIAKRYYAGYKHTTDTHYAHYDGVGTGNR